MNSVLHIDNSSFFKKMLSDIIGKKGYTYHSTDSVDGAFELLSGAKIDLIITAMEFKGGGGISFLEKLNESNYRNVPALVITSNDSIEERKRMFSLGVIDYIPKNASVGDKLFSFIEKLTEKNSARDGLAGMQIAVLDDSRTGLNVIKNILKLNGINNADFFSEPGQLLAKTKKYDMYLVGLVKPDISGEQVIIETRRKYSDSIIIAISAIDNYRVISNILLSGANDYVLKPFNSSIFMARIIASSRTLSLYRELQESSRRLKELSRLDPLTNLLNRYVISEKISDVINGPLKSGGLLSFIFLGIDHFVSINEQYGHKIGDKVLKNVARIIKEKIPPDATAGRYSGVEFILILPGMGRDEAFALAGSIRENISRLSLKNRNITVSGGAVEYSGETETDLLKKLETLLYRARKGGKNRIEF